MNVSTWQTIYECAEKWIFEAGELLKQSFTEKRTITYKSNFSDLVTDMDKKVEKFFIGKINETFPEHKILGEEGFGDEVTNADGVVWIVDPIDGTTNFVNQQFNFAISVGIYENGEGKIGFIYDVVRGELFHCMKGKGAYLNEKKLPALENTSLNEAVIGINATWVRPNTRIDHHRIIPIVKNARGTRSYGSAALELAYVACGRLDAYITMRLSPWDFAAGIILIDEVGGIVTTASGDEINVLDKNSIFAAKPGLHESILKEILR